MKTFLVRYLLPLVFLTIAIVGISYPMTDLVRGTQPAFDTQTLQLQGSPELAERGRHIFATRGCAECHGTDAGGKVFIDNPYMGKLAGSNLTKGSGGVGGNYKTIGDWQRAIRFGLNSSGHPLVFMPSYLYSLFSKQDLGALILFLYNVPPVNREMPISKPGVVPRVLYLAGQMPILFGYGAVSNTYSPPETVAEAATPEYGRYLSIVCTGCHGQSLLGGRGYNIDFGWPPSWPKAPGLTASGVVSTYSSQSFKSLMREGRTQAGSKLNPQHMPWSSYSQMSDLEIESIFLYLRSI